MNKHIKECLEDTMSYVTPLIILLIPIVTIAFFVEARLKAEKTTENVSFGILNNKFNLVLLFEHEGIKVYRFEDDNRYKYYTDSRGKVVWNETHGKTTVEQEVETR